MRVTFNREGITSVDIDESVKGKVITVDNDKVTITPVDTHDTQHGTKPLPAELLKKVSEYLTEDEDGSDELYEDDTDYWENDTFLDLEPKPEVLDVVKDVAPLQGLLPIGTEVHDIGAKPLPAVDVEEESKFLPSTTTLNPVDIDIDDEEEDLEDEPKDNDMDDGYDDEEDDDSEADLMPAVEPTDLASMKPVTRKWFLQYFEEDELPAKEEGGNYYVAKKAAFDKEDLSIEEWEYIDELIEEDTIQILETTVKGVKGEQDFVFWVDV